MKALLQGWNAVPRGLRVLTLSMSVLMLLYGPYLFRPNDFLFAGTGDGLKNYYSASYYVKYDSGGILSGMNYPNGEVVTFADGQFGITFFLQKLQSLGLPVSDYIIGILNLLMLLSLVVSQYVLYRILRHYGLPFGWAAAFGILIGLLTPQIERWTGHFGLGYLLFIPLIWWLYIQGREAVRRKWLFPSLNILLISYFALVHPYYLALSIVFFLGISLAELFGSESWRTKLWRSVTWAMVAIVPFLIVQLIMAQIDPVSDRPKAAWGIHYYRTNLASLFFFPNSEIFDALRLPDRSSESHQYIGLLNVLMILLVVILVIRTVLMQKWRRLWKNTQPASLNKALVSGTLAVLFAVGVPFIFNLEWITDWLYPITQFRSVGRFAWLFYIVFSVLTVREAYKLCRTLRWRGLNGLSFALMLLAGAIWSTDAFIRNRLNFWSMDNTSASWYEYSAVTELRERGYEPDAFQAILPIPYFTVGNEIWGYIASNKSVNHSFLFSYHSQLPILADHAARISQSQSLDKLQLFSDPKIHRELPGTLPQDKPLLLVNGHDYVYPWEVAYLRHAELIQTFEDVSLSKLPLSAMLDSSHHYQKDAETRLPQMIPRGTFYTDSTMPWVYYDGFEDDDTTTSMLGNGSFWATSGESVLCSISPNFDALPVQIEVSLWQKSYWRRAVFPELLIRRYNLEGNLIYEAKYGRPSEGIDIYKDWIRFACTTQIENLGERIEVVMRGSFQMADELLIRPKKAEVWTHVADSGLTINNYPVYPRP